jgi:hypothetical protein
MTTLEKLKKARDILSIKSRWTFNAYARTEEGEGCWGEDPAAVKWCLLGALFKHDRDNFTGPAYFALLRSAGGASLHHLNDIEGWQAVLGVYDRAIRELES